MEPKTKKSFKEVMKEKAENAKNLAKGHEDLIAGTAAVIGTGVMAYVAGSAIGYLKAYADLREALPDMVDEINTIFWDKVVK